MLRPFHIALLLLVLTGVRARAITIQLDYSYDSFFASNATAKATLEIAAADLSAVITSQLAAVSGDVYTGANGGVTATVDWSLDFTNPTTGALVTLETWQSTLFGADVVRIYVGMRSLSDDVLGTGGSGTAGFSLQAEFSGAGSLALALDQAEAASNAVMSRGTGLTNGPVLGTFSGDFGSTTYELSFGIITGNLWFDNDSDDDGFADEPSVLNDYWNFELALPAPTQNDFYSVALHELIHAIGFGIGIGQPDTTWGMKQSGTDWSGVYAAALDPNGGTALLTQDGHIRSSFLSPRLSDGALQAPVMTDAILQGTRKTLTEMDVAFLRDLNYAVVPEPSTGMLLGVASVLGLTSRRRSRRPAPCGDRSCRRS